VFLSTSTPQKVISTEGGALAAAVEKSAVAVAVAFVFACSLLNPKNVISTEGGAFAAAVEKSAVALAFARPFYSGHR
jgi:hypothetical protein